ncbi:ribonuclease HII [Listeria costaricensis]|uniref:ribonuclease HII n=1 Tax=Listeria costaricensis TaxID=2026604 RepID=UPI000C086BDA|nr:ribonuclease HII [Listeria costaricensis]
MTKTIETIKRELARVTHPDELTVFFSDSRKGVQKLVEQTDKRLKKEALLLEKYELMCRYERTAYQNGAQYIAGIDEVGRGPLAGPVVAAAVILPPDAQLIGVNDSKQLSEAKRDQLFDEITEAAIGVGIGIISHDIIDQVNIYEATKLAMKDAIENLAVEPDHLLIDAMPLGYMDNETSLIKGDSLSISIAAASIIAKVTRDRMMKQYATEYPGYDFEHNMGYGTQKHLQGLEKLGITPIHRKSFSPVKEAMLRFE